MPNVALLGCASYDLLLSEGFPWDDLRTPLLGVQRIANLQNGVEILLKIFTG